MKKKKTRDLFKQYQQRYPTLHSQSSYLYKDDCYHISIPSKKAPLCAWINEEQDGFIVGLDWLHQHFDYIYENERVTALQDAFEQLDAILEGRVVALYEKTSNEIRWVMANEEAHQLMKEQPDVYRLEKFERP